MLDWYMDVINSEVFTLLTWFFLVFGGYWCVRLCWWRARQVPYASYDPPSSWLDVIMPVAVFIVLWQLREKLRPIMSIEESLLWYLFVLPVLMLLGVVYMLLMIFMTLRILWEKIDEARYKCLNWRARKQGLVVLGFKDGDTVLHPEHGKGYFEYYDDYMAKCWVSFQKYPKFHTMRKVDTISIKKVDCDLNNG